MDNKLLCTYSRGKNVLQEYEQNIYYVNTHKFIVLRILSLVEHFCLNFLMGLLPLFKVVNVLKATLNIIYCIGKMCRFYGLSLSTIKMKI